VPLTFNNTFQQFFQFGIDRWFAAANRDNGRSRFFDRSQAVRKQHAIFEFPGMPFERASKTSQVAGVKRLEHQYHRITFIALEPVPNLMRYRIGCYV
jgi:hypothetical protein